METVIDIINKGITVWLQNCDVNLWELTDKAECYIDEQRI